MHDHQHHAWMFTGSRDAILSTRSITQAIRRVWYAFDVPPIDSIIVGDARGVDRTVARWADNQLAPDTIPTRRADGSRTGDYHTPTQGHTIPASIFRAYWDQEKGAGFRRNERMVKAGPALVIGITTHDEPSPGTRHAMNTAAKAGLPVIWFTLTARGLKAKKAVNVAWRYVDEDQAEAMLQPEEVAQ